jgi:SNF2 family DNA or RNA helicase
MTAHHIRNRSSQVFKATCAVPARNRWCLTGTPIQNCLDDYGALLSFLAVPPFETKSKFDFWIATPFKDQKPGALEKLQDLIRVTCLRRTKRLVKDTVDLPSFSERVQVVQFHPRDREIYNFFKQRTSQIAARSLKAGSPELEGLEDTNIISLLNFLRLVCNHGEDLLLTGALKAWKARDSALIDWEMMLSNKQWCEVCNAELKISSSPMSSSPSSRGQQLVCSSCASSSEGYEALEDEGTPAIIPASHQSPSFGRPNIRTTGSLTQPSAKIEALLKNLHQEQRPANHPDPGIVTKR